jgi:hypothetical protein
MDKVRKPPQQLIGTDKIGPEEEEKFLQNKRDERGGVYETQISS